MVLYLFCDYLLLKSVCDKSEDLLFLVKKHHDAKVANTLVVKVGAGDELQAFHLTKAGGVPKHVDVL